MHFLLKKCDRMLSMKNKKTSKIIILSLLALVMIVAGVIFINKRQKETAPPTEAPIVKKKRISAPINILDLDKRPLVSLKPFNKNGGRFVNINLTELREKAQTAEYEIIYQVIGASAVSASGVKVKVPEGEGEGTQGFIGELDLKQLPTKTENRFGTCSAGGACVNNNVSDGTLILNFEGEQKFSFATNWTYFENGNATSTTKDEAFSLTADGLSKTKDYLLMEVIGLPKDLPGEVLLVPDGGKDNGTKAVAYQINFTQAPVKQTARVQFQAATEINKVAVWDNQSWSVFSLTEDLPLGDGFIYALLNN